MKKCEASIKADGKTEICGGEIVDNMCLSCAERLLDDNKKKTLDDVLNETLKHLAIEADIAKKEKEEFFFEKFLSFRFWLTDHIRFNGYYDSDRLLNGFTDKEIKIGISLLIDGRNGVSINEDEYFYCIPLYGLVVHVNQSSGKVIITDKKPEKIYKTNCKSFLPKFVLPLWKKICCPRGFHSFVSHMSYTNYSSSLEIDIICDACLEKVTTPAVLDLNKIKR